MVHILEKIRKKISGGKKVLGCVVTLNDFTVSERLGYAGYDFLWIDSEHIGFDYNDILKHIVAASASGTASFVRIRENDPALVKPVLDMGADGIIFPLIKTVEDAKKAVEACLYPPLGMRGVGPGRAVRYGMDDVMEYIHESSKKKIFKILQVEHKECVDNLDEILKIGHIDAIMIGPSDLSASIGLVNEFSHPKVVELIESICETAKKNDVTIGAFAGSDQGLISFFAKMGAAIIAIGADGGFLLGGALKTLNDTKKQLEE